MTFRAFIVALAVLTQSSWTWASACASMMSQQQCCRVVVAESSGCCGKESIPESTPQPHDCAICQVKSPVDPVAKRVVVDPPMWVDLPMIQTIELEFHRLISIEPTHEFSISRPTLVSLRCMMTT
jgi:hypothetical protein